MKSKKISVCVPAYNRPRALKQLIASFLNQSYSNIELVIADDSSNSNVEQLVKSVNDKNIKYFKNKKNLGFSENLLSAINHAQGDYILILGDDDLLISTKTLKKYVDIFDKHQDVGYVYSNQVQFSDNLDIEYEIKMFDENKLLPKGSDTLSKIWYTSIFIGGLAIRNNSKIINEYYPKKKILHPQVQLVGNFIINFSSFVIKDHLIGFRSRETQFIFRAMKSKKIRKQGKHQNIELFDIFNLLKKKYSLKINSDFLAEKLINNSMILYPKEKIVLGNRLIADNYADFCKLSNLAKKSLKLRIIVYLSIIIPGFIIKYARNFSLYMVKITNKKSFIEYKKKIMKLITHKKTMGLL